MVSVQEKTNNNYTLAIAEQEYGVKNVSIGRNRINYALNDKSCEFVISKNEDGKYSISNKGEVHSFERKDLLEENFKVSSNSNTDADGVLKSSMPGKVIKILVTEGQQVKKDDELVIIESMKMENSYLAKEDLTIEKINIQVNDNITSDSELIIFGKLKNEE